MRNGTESFSADSPPIFNPNAHPIPSNPITGRQNNQGFEGLTMSEDGKSLFVLLQSAAIQDTGSPISATRRNTRLLQWNLNKGKWVGEWVVQLPTYLDAGATKIAAQSELHFLDDNRFLVLARDSSKGFGQSSSLSLYRHVIPFLKCLAELSWILLIFPARQTSLGQSSIMVLIQLHQQESSTQQSPRPHTTLSSISTSTPN